MILFDLFWTFFKIGAVTFGGGLAMLRIAQEQVLAKGWLNADQIIDFVALSESTPGPFAGCSASLPANRRHPAGCGRCA